MPASEVMSLFRKGQLHSGKGGPVVKSKKQATAIQISMARKEGHKIPYPSMQQGGLVPETAPYLLHRGETVVPAPPELVPGPRVGVFGAPPPVGSTIEAPIRSRIPPPIRPQENLPPGKKKYSV